MLKSGRPGKSLLGGSSGGFSKQFIDNSITGASGASVSGGTGTNLTSPILENVLIFSGIIDDVAIGTTVPGPGFFTTLQTGSIGNGYNVVFYGNDVTNYVKWDPVSATLNVQGSLVVREGSKASLGNITIYDNIIQAINTNGGIELRPQGTGTISLRGSLTQTIDSDVLLDKTINFRVEATNDINLSSFGQFNVESNEIQLVSQQELLINSVNGTRFTAENNIVYFSPSDDSTFIRGTNELMEIATPKLYIRDPLPIIGSPDGGDKGLMFQSGQNLTFMGILDEKPDTLTFIPDATVSINPDGSKNVSGAQGSLSLHTLQSHILQGSPHITLNATDIILDATNEIFIPDDIYLRFGSQGRIISRPLLSKFILGAPNELYLDSPIVSIGLNRPLAFDGDLRQSKIWATLEDGLMISSNSSVKFIIPVGGVVQLPDQVSLNFGDVFGQRIYSTQNGISIETPSNIYLKAGFPYGSVVIAQNTRLVLGDDGDYIVGLGTGSGIQIKSSGILDIESAQEIILRANNDLVRVVSARLRLPFYSALEFGGSQVKLENIPTGTILRSSNFIRLESERDIILDPLNSINVPSTKEINFGNGVFRMYEDQGNMYMSTTGQLILGAPTTINGDLIVNGTSTYIKGSITAFSDPVLSLGQHAPYGDIKDRGLEFMWYDGIIQKRSFMGRSTSQEAFVLYEDSLNTNDVFTPIIYGNLKLGKIYATESRIESMFITTLIGDPDILMRATQILMEATQSILFPSGIPLMSGDHSLSSTESGWVFNSPDVLFLGNSIHLGNAELFLRDVNNLEIRGTQNVRINSILHVESSIRFGQTSQVMMNVDAEHNLVLTSPSSIVAQTTVDLKGSFLMGNSILNWNFDYPGGRLVWKNIVANAPLNLSILGNILDATWKGNPIDLGFGGTGHIGSWNPWSVVFIASDGNSQTQDPQNFIWNNALKGLGIRTTTPQNTLSLGSGHIDMMGDDSLVLFRSQNQHKWALGSQDQLFVLKGAGIARQSHEDLEAFIMINGLGQVGIGQSSLFMSSISYQHRGSLFSNKSIWITTSNDEGIRWISSNPVGITKDANDHLHFRAPLTIINDDLWVRGSVFFNEGSNSYIRGNGQNIIVGSEIFEMTSDHNLSRHRLCFNHDEFGECRCYTTYTDGILVINNMDGGLALALNGNADLSVGTGINFLAGSQLMTDNGILSISALQKIIIKPNLQIPVGSSLSLGNATIIEPKATQTSVTSSTPINFTGNHVSFENGIKFSGGHSIDGTPDALVMTGNQKIILAGLNVHILGDLSVSGGVNYTITAETRIDSGILELGGGNITEINSISEWNPGYTVIGVTTPHQLVINDVVRISHSIPDIDGEYTVAQIPSNLQFVITKLTPINLSGAEGSAEGQVHSRLVSNMSGDGGIQVNWHTGMVPNTGGSRTAFFGVDRSTLRFIYIPEATRTPLDTFEGEFGDIQMKNFIGQGLAVSNLLAPLDAGNYLVKMGNATIGGGKINATPIGAETRNVGYFTNLVTQNLVVESGGLVSGFNADLLDGYDSSAFILRDGTFQLTANWYAGNVFIRSAFLESTTLEQNSVVFSGSSDGRLKTSSSFKFQDDVLAVPKILVQQVLGDVSFNDNTLSHLTIVSGNIYNSNISISPDKVFDASNGTVIFTNDQISGNWISGGTADINISGTAKFVENGIYTNDFGANTLLKADVDHQPLPLQVDEATLVGRLAGDHIRALNPTEVKNLLNVESPSPTSVYNQDALLRSGHLEMSEGGTMRGLFFESFEKISIQTDQDRDLDMDKQISFINVLFSALRDEAIINLDDGYADCHHKKIIITTLPKNKTLRLRGKIRAPLADEFIDLVFRFSGQSTSLVWEHTIGAWFIINTGADTEISI